MRRGAPSTGSAGVSRCPAAILLAAALAGACSSSSTAPPPASPAGAPAVRPAAARDRAPDWRDAIVYFVLIDRFANGDPANDSNADPSAPGAFHGGDLKGLVEHLDEIADLGVTAIWINPIVRNIPGFVTGAGFPDWGYHGYWADDFLSIDPRFGTEADLSAFVEACHRRGIKVLLDVVYNHAGYNSKYVTDPKTKGWFRTNELGTCGTDDVTTCVSGLPDFKTELPEVDEFLWNAQLDWGKRSGVDGFRLDTVKHVDHAFWKEHRKRSRAALGPRFFLLGEVWGGDREVLDPWFAGDEMDAGFDFSFQGSAVGWLLGRGRTVAFDRYLKSREKTRPGYLVSHFLSSHDVPGALSLLQGDAALFRLAAILQLTSIGIPTIYYGEEVARSIGDWPANRSDMPWGDRGIAPGRGKPRDEKLRADYRRWIGVRRAHPALSRGTHESVSSEGDLLVFARRDAESADAVIVAVNRGAAPATAKVAPPAEWADREVHDLLGQSAVARGDSGQVIVEVPAKSAAVIGLPSPDGKAATRGTRAFPGREASGGAPPGR